MIERSCTRSWWSWLDKSGGHGSKEFPNTRWVLSKPRIRRPIARLFGDKDSEYGVAPWLWTSLEIAAPCPMGSDPRAKGAKIVETHLTKSPCSRRRRLA